MIQIVVQIGGTDEEDVDAVDLGNLLGLEYGFTGFDLNHQQWCWGCEVDIDWFEPKTISSYGARNSTSSHWRIPHCLNICLGLRERIHMKNHNPGGSPIKQAPHQVPSDRPHTDNGQRGRVTKCS